MSWRERRLWNRLVRNGLEIPTTGDITQTESLDALTTSASFAPAGRPTLDIGDTVTSEWIDFDNGITRYQFGGQLLSTDTESDPQATDVPCQGPLGFLANARREADGDLLLNGMTDEEAVRAVIEYVGIPDFCGDNYDPTEIHGAGYVLGEMGDSGDAENAANLWWKVGDPGSSVVAELDDLFFYKTLEIQNCRIVRLFYDPAPDGTGVYRTYTRGVSRDLFSAHRVHGKPDQITSSYLVQGLQRDCGPDGVCQCQIYSKAFDVNPRLSGRSGRGHARLARGQYQSDIIQNESIAEWKVRELMRRNNRLSDELALGVLNDPNVHPCTVIGLQDTTTYIDADPRYYTVTAVDRNGMLMTITAIGGSAGDEGSVTTGVEQLCNTTEKTTTAPGPDVTPAIEYPPIDTGLPLTDTIDTGIDETTPPDITTPSTDCTALDGMVGTGTTDTGFLDISALTGGVWRGSGASSGYRLKGLHGEGGVSEIVLYGGGTAVLDLNETMPYADKVLLNDNTYDCGIFTLSFEVNFAWDGALIEVDFGASSGRVYPKPGLSITPTGESAITLTAQLTTENTSGDEAGNAEEHTCVHPTVRFNNGGNRHGGGVPLDTWTKISFTFDTSTWPESTYYSGPDGGYIRDFEICPPFTDFFGPFTPAPCTDSAHRVEISGFTEVGSDFFDPSIRIRGISIGHTTCTANEKFDPKTLGGGDGQ